MRGRFSLKSVMANTSRTILLFLLCVFASQAQPGTRVSGAASTEQQTARYFDSIRKSPLSELAFLLKMLKGVVLHNHLSDAIYVYSYIQLAPGNRFVIDTVTLGLLFLLLSSHLKPG